VADGVEDAVGGAAAVVGYLNQVVVGQVFLIVGQVLETCEGVGQLFLGEQEASSSRRARSAWRPECLPSPSGAPAAPMAAADMASYVWASSSMAC